jgi:hypothetical protein
MNERFSDLDAATASMSRRVPEKAGGVTPTLALLDVMVIREILINCYWLDRRYTVLTLRDIGPVQS